VLCLSLSCRGRSFTGVRRELVRPCLAPANPPVHAYHEGWGDDTLSASFYRGSPLVPGPEYRGSDAHNGGTFGNGGFQIVAHAHG
jgi:hypothetical protein